jgi:L-ribulose-5-phosphate 4-epimerase
VENAVVLEFVARLAGETLRINPGVKPIQPALLAKHFFRKHGPAAYYGQK